MAAIPGAELLQKVNACQARWMTHLIGDVHSGKADHAQAYLKDCNTSFAAHQTKLHGAQAKAAAAAAAANGVSGFVHLAGMGDYLDPTQMQAVAIGDQQRRQRQAMMAAAAQVQLARQEAAGAAKCAGAMHHAAQGTDPRRAGNAFYRAKHKLKRCRKKLRRCQARLEALQAGQSPEQAEVAAVKAAPPTSPDDTAGLGWYATPGSGIDPQYQQVESRPSWAGQLPAQMIAEGYAYRFPSTESAFLEREATVRGGHGGVYSGVLQAGVPKGIHPLLAARFAQMAQVQAAQQAAFAQPWTNPWSYQQFFAHTARGLPIWGGGYTQAFTPTGMVPGGTAGAQPAVAGAGTGGGFPQPGAAVERF